MTTRSKAVVCGSSLARIACSNPAGGMDVFLLCCFLLSGRDLCDVPIPRPEKFYLVCVSVYNRKAFLMRRLWRTRVCCAMGKNYSESNANSKNCCESVTGDSIIRVSTLFY